MQRSNSISRLPLPSRASTSTSTPNNASRLQRSLSSSSIGRSIGRPTSTVGRPTSSIRRSNSLVGRPTLSIGRSSAQKSSAASLQISRSRSPYKNNKSWLHDQHARICEYLFSSNPNLYPDGVKIHPPTIATFVCIMNQLFQKLDSRISITVENYKTTIPENLKFIQYPHPVAPSLLKTVNTMHAWPQVISIFSWLINFITFITSPIEDEFNSIILNYFASRYLAFCKESTPGSADVKDTATVDEEHKQRIEQHFKIDNEALAAAQVELKVKEKLCDEKKTQFNEMMEKKKNVQKEIDRIKAELDEFYNCDDKTETELLKSIEDLSNQVKAKENAIKATSAEQERLEQIVKTQKYSIKDKKALEMEIEDLKRANELKKEYFAEKMTLSDELDFKFIKAKKELDQEIFRINKELLPHCLFNKDLKKLELTVTNFVTSNFEENFREFLKEKEAVEKQYASHLEELKKSVSQSKEQKQILEAKTNEITECLAKLNEKSKSLEAGIKSQIEEINQIIHEADNKTKESFEDMHITNTQTLKNALTDLNKLYYKRCIEYKEIGERGLELAVTLHNMQVEQLNYVVKGEEFIVNTLQNNLQQIYEVQSKFLKQFERLEKENGEDGPPM